MGRKKYVVISGQYETYIIGYSDTLRGAKLLAIKNKEYWDNLQGWHKGIIYRTEDCEFIKAKGMITIRDGVEIAVPKYGVKSL